MPIKPENKKLYPKNWKQIRESILQRANNKCEFCGVDNYAIVQRKDKKVKIILTIAHLDHNPQNNNPENLRALCQKCHNTYDIEHRKETRKQTLKEKLGG